VDQATFEREDALHRQFWEASRSWISRDFAGKWVAIAHGKLIEVSPGLEGAMAAIQRLQPPPEYYLVFPVNEGPIWEVVEDRYTEFLPDETPH
jgi:hypothetical protein